MINQESDFQDILNMIEKVKKKAQKNLPGIQNKIDGFIVQKSINIIEIEHTLDTLLDYAMLDVGEKEFKRLNAYYESVNKNHADFYWQPYKDMLGL